MAESLQHPHTVTQFDYGRTESGYYYIVMELMRGQTMAERLKTHGTLPPPLIASIARAVLQVLELAHSQGIVHRDIKPENIMLCRIGAYHDVPKLLDFGAAKTTGGDHDITSAGMTLGSPAYMAPELLKGDAPGPTSDLYSLGLTLCEAILGHKLVPGSDALTRARAQLHPDPLPIPEQLANHPLFPWLSRAIQKPIAQRYASATEMRQALEHFLSQRRPPQPAPARQTPAPQGIPGQSSHRPAPDMLPENTSPMLLHPGASAADATAELGLHAPAEEDFDADPTEFLQNPFLTPENQPAPTPPPQHSQRNQRQQQQTSPTPPPAQWSPSFTRNSRHHDTADTDEQESKKVVIEPSFETDFQTIKTYDNIKEGHTIRVITGGLILLLFLLIIIYSSFSGS